MLGVDLSHSPRLSVLQGSLCMPLHRLQNINGCGYATHTKNIFPKTQPRHEDLARQSRLSTSSFGSRKTKLSMT